MVPLFAAQRSKASPTSGHTIFQGGVRDQCTKWCLSSKRISNPLWVLACHKQMTGNRSPLSTALDNETYRQHLLVNGESCRNGDKVHVRSYPDLTPTTGPLWTLPAKLRSSRHAKYSCQIHATMSRQTCPACSQSEVTSRTCPSFPPRPGRTGRELWACVALDAKWRSRTLYSVPLE